MPRQLLLVAGFVLLLRLPFLNHAVQGDDVYYLAGAQHALIDPAHPNHARYAFQGRVVDMRGHPHPPLNAWWLAGLLALFGDVHEVPFHAAYLLFSLIAAVSALWLARRFVPRPLPAAFLFLATPAFVVNGTSFESDVPFLALWLSSVALFIRAADRRSRAGLLAAVAAMSLASLAAYQAVVLMPVLAVWVWLSCRRWRPAWVALLAPAAALAIWQLYERLSTGALPAQVLAGYFETYDLQSLARKAANAAALSAHAGWLVCPALVWAAFARRRYALVAAVAAMLGAAFIDPHPLFWFSVGSGVLLLAGVFPLSRTPDDFLPAWLLLFFSAALVLFFAGAARYLLPIAVPAALIVARRLHRHPRLLWTGVAAQAALSLALASVNAAHWDGYRRFASSLASHAAGQRVWINGEWGLRFYLESLGGLPLLNGQPVQPGEIVVSSALAYPISFTTGGGRLAPLASAGITSAIPFRLIGLGSKSAYSTAGLGLRAFDISASPIDRLKAEVVVERPPERETLRMTDPEAPAQIVSGVYQLEENRYRWMGPRAVILLKSPPVPKPLEVSFYIPGPAPARSLRLLLDGVEVASGKYPGAGIHSLASPPVSPKGAASTLTIEVDRTFSPPGDQRSLGVILMRAGYSSEK